MSELQHLPAETSLLDVDESAWQRVIKSRGGCGCHISPPCLPCSEPITEEELNDVGFTYLVAKDQSNEGGQG